jgi:hypothetical protein
VARKISNLSPADWKAATAEVKQPFRKTAVGLLRTINGYEKKQVRKGAKSKLGE